MIKTFQELSKKRMRKVTKALTQLGITVAYTHTEEEAEVLMCDLQAAINRVEAVFSERWGWGDSEGSYSIPTATWIKLYSGIQHTRKPGTDVADELDQMCKELDQEVKRMTGFVVSTSVTYPKDPL
jgi:hypothetical protein